MMQERQARPRTVAGVLDHAATLVRKGWTRGVMARYEGSGTSCDWDNPKAGRFCASGAVQRSALGRWNRWGTVLDPEEWHGSGRALGERATILLAKAVGFRCKHPMDGDPADWLEWHSELYLATKHVALWNDAKERKRVEVVDALRAAAHAAREQEG